MSATTRWLRKQLAGIVALVLVAVLFTASRLPTVSASEQDELASTYDFAGMSISMPGGYPQQEIREVNQAYKHIDGWISSVGAGIAMNDMDGDGLPNDLCISEPRIDKVVVTPTPGPADGRYTSFALDPDPLPMNDTMAPMGCVPGDYNEDGRIDLLVYMWGRTPVVYLARPDATALNAAAYRPVELVPDSNPSDGVYTGPQWNSNTATVADFDGDGHEDIYIGNYFPNSPMLDSSVDGGVEMNDSLSNAYNGGPDYFFRWNGATSSEEPAVSYEKLDDVLPDGLSHEWGLGAAATDLDGDLRPELYLANDHGPDALLHNRSEPGKIELVPVDGVRSPMVPKSKTIGKDSFKGMGIDFGDLNHDGVYDMFVSNITTPYGVQESNFQFVSTVHKPADVKQRLLAGEAPWEDRSTDAGTAWGGWCWDVKMADFNNSGELEIVQTNGFVQGKVNRWPQLQELATANDLTVEDPDMWPRITQGDDLAGSQTLNFFARTDSGRFVDLADELGLDVPIPTRGIATGDADGDGRLDFAVARQWEEPVFYHNQGKNPGDFLGLRLTRDTPRAEGPLPAAGSPVVGAQVKVTTPDGRELISHVDGGGGHSGKRSHEVHIGLGEVTGPLRVELSWRDRSGTTQTKTMSLTPGWHAIELGARAEER